MGGQTYALRLAQLPLPHQQPRKLRQNRVVPVLHLHVPRNRQLRQRELVALPAHDLQARRYLRQLVDRRVPRARRRDHAPLVQRLLLPRRQPVGLERALAVRAAEHGLELARRRALAGAGGGRRLARLVGEVAPRRRVEGEGLAVQEGRPRADGQGAARAPHPRRGCHLRSVRRSVRVKGSRLFARDFALGLQNRAAPVRLALRCRGWVQLSGVVWGRVKCCRSQNCPEWVPSCSRCTSLVECHKMWLSYLD